MSWASDHITMMYGTEEPAGWVRHMFLLRTPNDGDFTEFVPLGSSTKRPLYRHGAPAGASSENIAGTRTGECCCTERQELEVSWVKWVRNVVACLQAEQRFSGTLMEERYFQAAGNVRKKMVAGRFRSNSIDWAPRGTDNDYRSRVFDEPGT